MGLIVRQQCDSDTLEYGHGLSPVLVPNISLTPWQRLGYNPSLPDCSEPFTYQLLEGGLQPSPGPVPELSGFREKGRLWATALARALCFHVWCFYWVSFSLQQPSTSVIHPVSQDLSPWLLVLPIAPIPVLDQKLGRFSSNVEEGARSQPVWLQPTVGVRLRLEAGG